VSAPRSGEAPVEWVSSQLGMVLQGWYGLRSSVGALRLLPLRPLRPRLLSYTDRSSRSAAAHGFAGSIPSGPQPAVSQRYRAAAQESPDDGGGNGIAGSYGDAGEFRPPLGLCFLQCFVDARVGFCPLLVPW